MKASDEVEAICKKLKPAIGDRADSLWHMYLAENFKGRQELKEHIEIIAEKYLNQKPLDDNQVLLTPPSVKDASGKFLVGKVRYNHQTLHSLYLRPEDFIKQVGIFAITGEGKTNLAYLQALQLLKNKTPLMIIDWKRSWRNLLSLNLPELKDVKVFTIGRDTLPFLWNPLRPPPGADKNLWISTVAEALEKSHLSGPGVAYHFNKIYSKLFRTLPDDFYPNFYDGLKEIHQMKVHSRELKWKQTAQRIFQSFTMGGASKVFNARNPIKLEELLDKPVIFELDMELPKPLRIFFSEMILRWIHLYRLGQGETDKLRHVLFLEEVHNLFANPFMNKEAGSLENVYREIRGFGQGLVSITQHPSVLPVYLLGNCHTQIYLGLQHADDIRAARQALFLRYDEESYPSLLNIGECIVKIKNRIEPCLVKTALVPVAKGLSDRQLKMHNLSSMFWQYAWKDEKTVSDFKKKIRGILEKKIPQVKDRGYFTTRKPVNKPFHPAEKPKKKSVPPYLSSANIYGSENKKPPGIKSHHRLLIDMFENPLCGVSSRYKRLGVNPRYGNRYKNRLISEGCIQPRKLVTDKYQMLLFDITQKGRLVLNDLGYDAVNKSEGIIHKFWKHKIADDYKAKGYDVEVEAYINGRPDIIAKKGRKRIAIEIETGKSDFMKNIQRNLDTGFDEIICVATDEKAERKLKKKLSDEKNKKLRVCIGN